MTAMGRNSGSGADVVVFRFARRRRVGLCGYAISNDLSDREVQWERRGKWEKGKCCETFNRMGPWLGTQDEVVDVRAFRLRLS